MGNEKKSFLINGKYCTFNFSNYPDKKDRANILLRYIDNKILLIFHELELDLPKNKTEIYFYDEAKAHYDPVTKIIRYGLRLSQKDLGCLIHEVVHYAQNYQFFAGEDQIENTVIAEGMADYFRHKLSDDGWDNSDEPNPYPHNKFHSVECRPCMAKFIRWLEKKSGRERFIVKLHLFLKDKKRDDKSGVNPFMQNNFGKDFKPLLDEFEIAKSDKTNTTP
ncbi:MAG: hypothetical protein A2W05_02630 [Candidatus Schekmanbacteria bacterium RBG_16_38_10]|uniref:Uncharacterized protein n=1 Tax=Candidatus Schekmanbacteria bacterium RBG_16_38_10 TaxID=1817879 RepID=A0A1F7RN52_9BACT|nr:MAG: hypothetical protein A2W05_02630 [Candidatus Schekmanbacteria bacterium RBG_16_38_10]